MRRPIHRPHDQFGPCVGVAVFVFRPVAAAGFEVLLLRRAGGGHEGEWRPVAGRTEIGEDALSAARRELEEEIRLVGLTIHRVDFKTMIEARGRHGHLGVYGAFPEPGAEVVLNAEPGDAAWLPLSEARDRLALREQREAFDAAVGQLLEPDSPAHP